MIMTGNFARWIALFLTAVIACACAGGMKDAAGPDTASGIDPLNAAYIIEDRHVPLVDGRFRTAAAPGSATLVKASVFGQPLYGDLDEDGDDDAVVVIVYDPGGSGTFYYIAAAINQNGRFQGTAGHLLGDRIIARFVKFDNGLVTAHFLNRRPEEPMSAPPTVLTAVPLRLIDGRLAPVKTGVGKDLLLEGWVNIGHEVRTFLPCDSKTEHWLLGDSPALEEIISAYRAALPKAEPYTPLFMILTGSVADPPPDGFGADYDAALYATRLAKVQLTGNCRQEFIVVASPRPGAVIRSPFKIKGQARGTWFFEGDFPIILKDHNGRTIASGFVTAKGPWMTKNFVPFEGTLTFDKPTAPGRGALVFQKDNPTDRPELDDAMELPVHFK